MNTGLEMIHKQLKIGFIGLTITLGDRIVEVIRSNMFYRFLFRPVQRLLFNLIEKMKNKENKAARTDESSSTHQTRMSEFTPEQKAILGRISEVEWYHSIDLGHFMVTPGLFDHRPLLPHYHLPENLKDMRILDVATYDGFWAFEFEKRGAAEVVAMDIGTWNEIDIPPRIRAEASKELLDTKTGNGFNIAKDILGSKVRRKLMNVYDLSPQWMGKFDFVFCSDLLLHLMNPMKALQNILSVVSGYAYIVDVFNPEFGDDESNAILRYAGGTDRMVWWRFGLGSLKKMITDAGFRKVGLVNKFEFSVKNQKKMYWHAVFKAEP